MLLQMGAALKAAGLSLFSPCFLLKGGQLTRQQPVAFLCTGGVFGRQQALALTHVVEPCCNARSWWAPSGAVRVVSENRVCAWLKLALRRGSAIRGMPRLSALRVPRWLPGEQQGLAEAGGIYSAGAQTRLNRGAGVCGAARWRIEAFSVRVMSDSGVPRAAPLPPSPLLNLFSL